MGSQSTSTRSKILQLAACFLLCVVVLSTSFRFVAEPQDRTRCHGMLNDGWWSKENHTQWQPSGCMPHTYTKNEIAQCLNHSRILYVGDSIMREQFYSMTRFVRPLDIKGALHIDRKYTVKELGLELEFWWDPYINSTRTQDMLKVTDPTERPSLLVIGSGIWYMRHLKDQFFDEWRVAVERVLDAVQNSNHVADAVMLSPVEIPQFNRLNPVRRGAFTTDKIKMMNDYLKVRERELQHTETPFVVPFAWNTIAANTLNETDDGLHYHPIVTSTQASLALNYRCNDMLPKQFPMSDTCCYHYPTPAWYQNIFLLYFLAWVPLGFYVLSNNSLLKFMRRFYPGETPVLGALFVFGLGVTYMYFGDRTHLFGKALKVFSASTFTWLMILTALGGVMTLRRKKEGDQGFLNRAQTDEWKGWMQIIILVYHFMGASQTAGIYNAVRILVAAYLFQTGYGHFFFFYKKGDFGIQRVLNVMVRLNMLTFVLQYVMATDYLSYYFTPLVSFWFGVIWLTMYVGNSLNKKYWWFVLIKMVIAACITGAVIHAPGVLETLFDVLQVLFNIHWNAPEWRFRLALDAWVVYVGMLAAFATIKFNEHKLGESRVWPVAKLVAAILSVVAMVWYFWFELSQPDKKTYNSYHPYISWIPILAFVVLRNATVLLRNTTSGFYEYVGKCSLETFIGQFHMWLAADTKGLLIVLTDPAWARNGTLGWWLNLALSSVIFMFVCHHLNRTTGEITKWICTPSVSPNEHQHQHQNDYTRVETNEQDVPLLPTSRDSTESKPEQQADDEEWAAATAPQKPSRWKRWTHAVCSDLRVKSIVFLIVVGILNRFC